MAHYRIADVTVRLAGLSPFAREFLKDYRVDGDVFDEDLSLTAADFETEAAIAPTAPREVLEITAVLRKVAAMLLGRYDGCMLHAATIVYGGKAYAFVAPSGSGKTTHCRLWLEVLSEHARILNGDKLLLRRDGDRFLAYGNPWNGKEGYGERGCYPLGGVFLLHRAAENTLCPVSPTDALAALLPAVAVSKDAAARLQALALLDALVSSGNIRALYVNRQPEAVFTVLGGLEEFS